VIYVGISSVFFAKKLVQSAIIIIFEFDQSYL